MQQFCETFCLHDAEVLGMNVSGGDNGARTPVAVISVRQDNQLIWLVYDLYEQPRITTPVSSDAFVRPRINASGFTTKSTLWRNRDAGTRSC